MKAPVNYLAKPRLLIGAFLASATQSGKPKEIPKQRLTRGVAVFVDILEQAEHKISRIISSLSDSKKKGCKNASVDLYLLKIQLHQSTTISIRKGEAILLSSSIVKGERHTDSR